MANMSRRTVASERRKEARKRPLSLVYVELSAANGGMLRDLSELGFAMRAMMPLRVGEITAFSFMLGTTTRVEGQCKVLWVEEDGRLAGMQFTEVAENLRSQVRAWLGEKRVYTAPPAPPAPIEKAPRAETMEELLEELRTVVARPETPQRDELPLPELHEKHPSPTKEKPGEAVEVAESALTILREIEVTKPSTESETAEVMPSADVARTLEALHSDEPLPVLEEAEFTPEVKEPKPWQNREVVWLAIRMMIAFALIAAAIAYHRPVGRAVIWLGEKIAGEEAPEVSPVPKSEIQPSEPEASPNIEGAKLASVPDAEAANAPASSEESAKVSKESATSTDQKTAAAPSAVGKSLPTGTKGALPPAPVPLPATSRITTFMPLVTPSADGGQQEYLAAQEILKNKNEVAGFAEAVRLLWVAVEKGNSGAEVALAGLYWRGHGVAKNCDQTRILLTAAAKKGNVQAQEDLDQFLGEGCE